jgi:hypothetical protein
LAIINCLKFKFSKISLLALKKLLISSNQDFIHFLPINLRFNLLVVIIKKYLFIKSFIFFILVLLQRVMRFKINLFIRYSRFLFKFGFKLKELLEFLIFKFQEELIFWVFRLETYQNHLF